MRDLCTIAHDIQRHWPKVHYAALPYLRAMGTLRTLDDNFGYDPADHVVMYFLSNAGTWRGEEARRLKAELNQMLKDYHK